MPTAVKGKIGPAFTSSEKLEPIPPTEAAQLIRESDNLTIKRLAATVIGLNRELELAHTRHETRHGFAHK